MVARWTNSSGWILCILVASACVLTVAEIEIEEDLFGQNGRYSRFPYCNCINRGSPYSLDPVITSYGNATYCFTLRVNIRPTCTGSCCLTDVKKLEIDVNQACAVKSATVLATVNGKFTTIGPNIYYPQEGPVNSTVMKLNGLGLGLSDGGAQICITLRAGRNDTGCDTIEELCKPPASAPPGTCNIVLFNSLNNTDSCCPQSTPSPPKPPSPHPPSPRPPSPRPPSPSPPSPSPPPQTPPPPPSLPPSPPPTCGACFSFTIQPVSEAYPPYRLDDTDCSAIQGLITSALEITATLAGVPMPIAIAPSGDACTTLAVSTCASYFSEQVATATQKYLSAQLQFVVNTISETVCPGTPNSYVFRIDTQPGGCVSDSVFSSECKIDPTPPCKCNATRFITPFFVLPTSTALPGGIRSGRSVTLHCFKIAEVPQKLRIPGPCANATMLTKVEIWADKTKSSVASRMRVTPYGGTPRFISASWGKWYNSNETSMKATNLGWTYNEAVGGEVCLELPTTLPLRNFCITGKCYLNLFSDNSCCPTYPSGLPTVISLPRPPV